MRYGMSSLGRVNFQKDRSSPFLAGSGGSVGGQLYSEVTAHEIDKEVSRIIEEAVERVRDTLKVRIQALQALTDRLIEVESVDSDELKTIMDENSPGPLLVPGTNVKPDTAEEEASQSDEDHGTDLNAAQ